MNELLDSLGRRFARVVTNAVVVRPALWPLFRGPLRAQFDRLASTWEGRLGPEALAPLGFRDFEELAAGVGRAFLARKV